eukprot:CAMPEP_0185747288 /NCGR_PEP_ID=MMETSP1174-20130828/5890_1 /TAXON_ID=35687 /ORGANISM="Dictyocha speculum, Strain CCMP1381" /LENGTH=43 /DNA_ID= /DNA_START= /DNA_END= /DNA_ORIENTATION=
MDDITDLPDEEVYLDDNGVLTVLSALGFQSNLDFGYEDANDYL